MLTIIQDLQILINAVHTPSVAANSASWLPICLPKFNPQGFVHAYVNFIEADDSPKSDTALWNKGKNNPADFHAVHTTATTTAPASETSSAHSVHGITGIDQGDNATSSDGTADVADRMSNNLVSEPNEESLVLVTICGGGEFDGVRNWGESVVKVRK